MSRRTLYTVALLALSATATGCLEDTPRVLLAPDASATGEDGARGSYGVGWIALRTQGRVSDPIRYDVSWPALSNGDLDAREAPYPVLVLIQGGDVATDRYQWLATHVASRGFVVVAPHHALDLAILESDNGSIALDDLLERAVDPDERLAGSVDSSAKVAAAGHSLGGVVASMRWVADERIDAVAMFAGYAPGSTDVESMGGHPSLLLTGSEDRIPPEDFVAQYARYPEPGWFGTIDGMNHFDWTDAPEQRELANDGVSTRPPEASRRDALRVFDTWMDAFLLGDTDAAERLAQQDFQGVAEGS